MYLHAHKTEYDSITFIVIYVHMLQHTIYIYKQVIYNITRSDTKIRKRKFIRKRNSDWKRKNKRKKKKGTTKKENKKKYK